MDALPIENPNPSEIRQLWLGGFSQQSSNHQISKSLFSQPHSVLGVKSCVVIGFVKAFYMSWVIWDFWKGLWKALPFKPHSETNTYELCDAKIYLQPVFHLDLWKHFVWVLKAIWDFWKGFWRAWNSPLQTSRLVCMLFIDLWFSFQTWLVSISVKIFLSQIICKCERPDRIKTNDK